MKKLISAAASLAMAASMVGSAVPFATGAADSSKSLEIRAFNDVNGKPVSTTISADAIAAGDVTVPIGIFLVEGTNDCDSITAQWTVNSANGDASNKYVKFVSHEVGDDYYAEPQTVTLADGKSGSITTLPGFTGIIKTSKKGDKFSPIGSGQYFALESSKSANTPNAFGSLAWITAKDGSGYTWAGSKSDEFPVYVQDVVFAQGTPAGTYTIDFVDYVPDAEFPDNMSNMIETAAGKMTTKKSNLTLKGLEITIGDGGAPVATTTTSEKTPAATTTTTSTEKGPIETTTSSKKSEDDKPGKVDEGFIITPADATVKPGESVSIDIMCENTSNRKAGQFIVRVDDANLPIKGATATMEDTGCYAVSGNKEYELINDTWYCDTLKSGEPQEINTDEAVCQFEIKVPADAKPGTYEWTIDRFHVVENGYDGVEFDANIKPGKLVVEGDVAEETTTTTKPVETTTTTATETTKATESTTKASESETKPVETTTTATPGSKLYGDTNCDGRVNIADVVVLNKYLNDATSYKITDQGKINADCCDPKDGAGLDENDSDAIIKSIVHLVKALPCTAADLK